MKLQLGKPSKQRIVVSPPGRGWKARPEIAVNPEYVRKLLEQNRLTERDETLLLYLHGSVKVLSARQVRRLLWFDSTPSNMHRRLRQLYDYYLLDRTRMLDKKQGITYTLGKAGRIWLKAQARGGGGPLVQPKMLAHELAISEVMVRMTEELRRVDPEALMLSLEWRNEARARIVRDDKVLLEPDAWFRIGWGEKGRVCYLEMDMGTEGPQAIDKKVRRYLRALTQAELVRDEQGNPVMIVVLTTTAERAESIARAVVAIQQEYKEHKMLPIWFVGVMAEFEETGFYDATIWRIVQRDQITRNKIRSPWTSHPAAAPQPAARPAKPAAPGPAQPGPGTATRPPAQ